MPGVNPHSILISLKYISTPKVLQQQRSDLNGNVLIPFYAWDQWLEFNFKVNWCLKEMKKKKKKWLHQRLVQPEVKQKKKTKQIVLQWKSWKQHPPWLGLFVIEFPTAFGSVNYRVRFQIERLFTKTEENPRGYALITDSNGRKETADTN